MLGQCLLDVYLMVEMIVDCVSLVWFLEETHFTADL